jgi:hypothetical protein
MKRLTALFGMALAAASCATSAEKSASAKTGDAADGVTIGALEEAALPKGSCGMILWTLEAQQPTPIFRMTAGKAAEIVLNGEKVSLALADVGGASAFGVFEETGMTGEGVVANVRARFGLGFDGGVYVERGLLTVETADGWRSVVPAAGVAGCRAK